MVRPRFGGRLEVSAGCGEAFVQDCRRLEVAVHNLLKLPPASLVEVDCWPSRCDPQLLVSLVARPSLEVPEQQPSQTCASAISTNDHAQHPWRSVAPFLNVKLT